MVNIASEVQGNACITHLFSSHQNDVSCDRIH